MTTLNEEDREAAEAWWDGWKCGDWVAFAIGYATAREKYQEEIEALSRTLNDMNEGGLETEAKLEKAEALLREVVIDLHESVRKGWVQLAPETQAALDRARAHLGEQ